MTDWQKWLPLPKCERTDCDWQITNRLNVHCVTCKLGDSRASRFFRLLHAGWRRS